MAGFPDQPGPVARRRGFRVYSDRGLRRPVPRVGDWFAWSHLLAGGHQVPGDRPGRARARAMAALACCRGRSRRQPWRLRRRPLRSALPHCIASWSMSGIALAVMTVISVGLGWLVAGRMLRPLRMITTAARRISASNLHERLAMTGPDDELRELSDTFDGLLGRLERAFDAQRQFVANASHELRTPLARQRAFIEVALDDAGTHGRFTRKGLCTGTRSQRAAGTADRRPAHPGAEPARAQPAGAGRPVRRRRRRAPDAAA